MVVVSLHGGPAVFNGRVFHTDSKGPGSKISLSLVTQGDDLFSVRYEVGENNRDCFFLECINEGKHLSGPGYDDAI